MPAVGPNNEPDALPMARPGKESLLVGNTLDRGLDGVEPHSPMKRTTLQHPHRDLVEAQLEGSFGVKGSEYSQIIHNRSKHPEPPSELHDNAPPQTIRVVRFPKNEIEPNFAYKQTVDVKADNHRSDERLGHIPDFRDDWGDGENWKLYRRAYPVFVAPTDISEDKLHGWYVVFSAYDPSYAKNTHRVFEGYGRHVHEDFFIAKISTYPTMGKWTVYVDMPDEFLSATTQQGRPLYRTFLEDKGNSMIGTLIA